MSDAFLVSDFLATFTSEFVSTFEYGQFIDQFRAC